MAAAEVRDDQGGVIRSLDDQTRARLGRAVSRSLGGEAADVVDELAASLAGSEDMTPEAGAAVAYVLAVAHNENRSSDRAIRAATRGLALAEEVGDPGWIANLLVVRGIADDRAGHVVAALDDLTRAEHEVQQSDEPGLQAWAHSWFGDAYEQMWLYELAAEHYARCVEIGADPFPLPQSAFIDQLSLATLHARWATELKLLDLDDSRTKRQLAEVLQAARVHAERAVELARTGASEQQHLDARLLRIQHEPERIADHLAELVDIRARLVDLDDTLAVSATTTLAQALHAVGRTQQAIDEAQRAIDGMPSGTDLLASRHAHWVYLHLARRRDEEVAKVGLALSASTARTWWAQRTARVAAVRSAISGYADSLAREVESAAARHDALTGLRNRRAFDEALDAVGDDCALLLIDVDRLKQINDTWGHAAGDTALVATADVIRRAVRAGDAAFRLGGDEFAILVSPADLALAERIGHRVHDLADEAALAAAEPVLGVLSVSIGCASTSEDWTVAELSSVADRRLYDVKAGRRVDPGWSPEAKQG